MGRSQEQGARFDLISEHFEESSLQGLPRFGPCSKMAPRKCVGFAAAEGEVEPCVFNANVTGGPATAKFGGRCVWCSPEEMGRRLGEPRLEKLLVYTLVNFKSANEEVFEKATGRLPEDRRADILAEVAARLEPEEEEDMEMEPVEKGADGESEENDAEALDFAGLEILPDNPSDASEGEEANIDAVDVGDVDFGDALDEVELPLEPLEPERDDVEMERGEPGGRAKEKAAAREAGGARLWAPAAFARGDRGGRGGRSRGPSV